MSGAERGRKVPIDHGDDSHKCEHNSCVVEVLRSLMKVLVEFEGEDEERGGEEEPNDCSPTDGKRVIPKSEGTLLE